MSWQEPTGWPADAGRDRLIGHWYLYQRKGGHRTSTDDLVTAWYAIHRNPQGVRRYLDIGCGVGSVLLMVSHKLRPAVCDGVEAQAQSVAMALRAIDELPPHGCAFSVRHSDFRDIEFGADSYDLVTGSPPYFPIEAGVLPDDAQRRACRFEARGGVEVYVETAARALSDSARFYLVYQSKWNHRVKAAAEVSSLHVTGQADFLMRRDRPDPFLTVFELAREPAIEPHRFQGVVREANGEVSCEYNALRRELGVAKREGEKECVSNGQRQSPSDRARGLR